jgi:hypothetical protein
VADFFSSVSVSIEVNIFIKLDLTIELNNTFIQVAVQRIPGLFKMKEQISKIFFQTNCIRQKHIPHIAG